ncbi:hypothetical protein JCM10213_001668 [Rhodosporidiobolus nylandii]
MESTITGRELLVAAKLIQHRAEQHLSRLLGPKADFAFAGPVAVAALALESSTSPIAKEVLDTHFAHGQLPVQVLVRGYGKGWERPEDARVAVGKALRTNGLMVHLDVENGADRNGLYPFALEVYLFDSASPSLRSSVAPPYRIASKLPCLTTTHLILYSLLSLYPSAYNVDHPSSLAQHKSYFPFHSALSAWVVARSVELGYGQTKRIWEFSVRTSMSEGEYAALGEDVQRGLGQQLAEETNRWEMGAMNLALEEHEHVREEMRLAELNSQAFAKVKKLFKEPYEDISEGDRHPRFSHQALLHSLSKASPFFPQARSLLRF